MYKRQVQYTSVRKLVGSEAHHRPAQLCVCTSQIRSGQLLNAVVCQFRDVYKRQEYGEYVRTTDGGVLYKVYDETGQIAPKAQVKGMPGINARYVLSVDAAKEFLDVYKRQAL